MAPTKKARPSGKAAGKAAARPAPKASKPSKPAPRTAAAAKAKPAAKPAAKKKASVKAPVKPAPKAKAPPVKAAPAKPAAKTPPKPAPAKAAKPEPAPAPKAPPKRKGNPAGLTPKDLESIKAELLSNRATLEKEFEDLEIGSLHVAQSELSGEVSFDEEYADAGTFTFERERDLSLSNNIRDLMDKVDTALKRLADGSYGACERCGRPIDKARLKALPYSVLCISCKQREERTR